MDGHQDPLRGLEPVAGRVLPRALYLVLQSHSSSFPAALPDREDLGNPSPGSNPRGFQRLITEAACSAGGLGLWPQGFHREMSEQEVASTRPVLSNLYLQARGQRPTVVNKGLHCTWILMTFVSPELKILETIWE